MKRGRRDSSGERVCGDYDIGSPDGWLPQAKNPRSRNAGASAQPASGRQPEHVNDGRHRSLHHDPCADRDDGWTAVDDRLGLGAAVALCDGMVWSELASAFPGSGGTYHFYDSAYGNSRAGRLLKFLFVWQFLFSGPLEIASGAIGLATYLGYFYSTLAQPAWTWNALFPSIPGKVTWGQLAAMGVMVTVTGLAYRRVAVAGRLMVVLWAGMLITVAWVIGTGMTHFDAARAFDFPDLTWGTGGITSKGLGAALAIAMYSYLGYYQICYLGDEVANPSRTIPRSILISVAVIAVVYLTMNIGIVGVLPWREVVSSPHIASDLMLRVYGHQAAALVTAMIIWTALASVYSALLGYSRIPYASARAGHFFRAFAQTHPTRISPTGHFS